jgi:hypothetical protein
MNSIRSTRATYMASFLLGVLVALIVAKPARAAEPFRLDRIGVVQFTALGEGVLRRQSGVLHQDGRISWRITSEVPRPANTPEWALGRTLVTNAAWLLLNAPRRSRRTAAT